MIRIRLRAPLPRWSKSRSGEDEGACLSETRRQGRCELWTVLTISFAFALAGCPPPPSKPNQRQRAVSPSGRYIVQVPIEGERSDSKHSDPLVWKVTILDSDGNVLYKDEDSTFVGTLNVYWLWDDSDRVWLYNSDNGKVYFWELTGGSWDKQEWGYGRLRKIGRDITPPAGLYPDYAR